MDSIQKKEAIEMVTKAIAIMPREPIYQQNLRVCGKNLQNKQMIKAFCFRWKLWNIEFLR
jgi:hypothetical protein